MFIRLKLNIRLSFNRIAKILRLEQSSNLKIFAVEEVFGESEISSARGRLISDSGIPLPLPDPRDLA